MVVLDLARHISWIEKLEGYAGRGKSIRFVVSGPFLRAVCPIRSQLRQKNGKEKSV